jgi:hypothetical protein
MRTTYRFVFRKSLRSMDDLALYGLVENWVIGEFGNTDIIFDEDDGFILSIEHEVPIKFDLKQIRSDVGLKYYNLIPTYPAQNI